MIFSMGCGGSRADAIIEPRYHESWTRETESTWLTNTDVETPLPVANSKSLEPNMKEKRMVNTGTQCGKQALSNSGSNHQRRARHSLSDVGVTGSSRPLVTQKEERQRMPVLCLRMGSPSASTVVEILNLETRVMKDEGKPRLLCRGRQSEQQAVTRTRDGDLQMCVGDVCS
ncbi:uncharacterized protein LOC114432164 isoform X1 [Parambassis ranga]|uniref:Uncharacterized protein LOC114432164 isoform X1 n=1 Tax=Parambassis ranga TaxID=210632 RepID=A0A6P7HQ08_9TELE|nr:uncharacterized protein LOC114432164 isoform X1 [Parambassis ranga]